MNYFNGGIVVMNQEKTLCMLCHGLYIANLGSIERGEDDKYKIKSDTTTDIVLGEFQKEDEAKKVIRDFADLWYYQDERGLLYEIPRGTEDCAPKEEWQ